MTPAEEDVKNDEARFLALVTSISSSAMQHLGKVMNPLTGKVERNLPAAREMIDILRMLREKTRGNLTDREERTLNALIGSVQLNYLDEMKAEAEKPEERPPEEKPTPQGKEEKAPEQKEEVKAQQKTKPRGGGAEQKKPPEGETGKRRKGK